MKSLTPFGVSEFIPEEALRHNALNRQISDYFESNGFVPIRTPVVEYFDTLALGLDPALSERAIRFFDASGALMILRPDHTTPIARLVANRLTEAPLPLKLYYLSPVFRNPLQGELSPLELFQAGIEWIGTPDLNADAAVMAHCIHLLNELGFSELGIDVGHPAFADDYSESEKQFLIAKDYVQLGRIPARGGRELVGHIPDLAELDTQLSALEISGLVTYNTGQISAFNYYTGPNFEVYAKGCRQMVARGGRYDRLLSKFGYDCPAVGFALNLNVIQEALANR
ncbi:hypothetical protein EBR96_02785 [bacterium]|nr:hypothetical protein [bacterium]